MIDERGVDSLPVALASSLIVLAIIMGLAAMGIRQAGPLVSTASMDGQVSMLADDCRGLIAGSPRDLLDPASPPGSHRTAVLSLPPDLGYLAFGTDPGSDEADEGTIYYEVHGNKKAVVVDPGVKLREGIKKGDVYAPSRRHMVIEGGGKYELTVEYEYDRGLGERYLIIY